MSEVKLNVDDASRQTARDLADRLISSSAMSADDIKARGWDPTNLPEIHSVTAPAADAILAETKGDLAAISALEDAFVEKKQEFPLFIHLAAKLARSKALLASIDGPAHISVVWAVYNETQRMRPRSDDNPMGEDFLMAKIAQMQWLLGDKPNVGWDLYMIDDGSSDGTADEARQLLASKYEGNNVHVAALADAIEQKLPVAAPMTSPKDSRKGGSIHYGMWLAQQKQLPAGTDHVIVFTDADLSSHLGMSGLLMHPIIKEGFDVAIGSRRETRSVVVKGGSRNSRGKLFIYLRMRVLPELNHVVDSQCGFKAFRGSTVEHIVTETIEKQFAFDMELILKAQRHVASRDPLTVTKKIPIAWVDSEALSTTTDQSPYLSMLKKMVEMRTTYPAAAPSAETDAFAAAINSMTEESFATLVNAVPPAIADKNPQVFGTFNEVSADELLKIANSA